MAPAGSLIGHRIGPYRVLALLGAGSMGEVYRGRDDRLGRDVAIKVLPASFTLDVERRERFEREARVLAALNHPSIAAIYGYEEAEGIHALVLELVEGRTLAERRTAGPVLLQDALTIARQIAEALEAAHARGIVHRDIKPANIKVSPDGRVKVLDFGLAKTLDEDGAAASPEAATQLSGPSERGMILGTAPYMSPEQARGKPVDQRTDIWAFGCVLYEMLTGQMAFSGLTMSDAMVAVLERDPNWNALPKTVPDRIGKLLRRCLQKDQQQRLRDIGDARLELAEALGQIASVRAEVARPRRRSVALAGIAATILVVVVGWIGVQRLSVASSVGAGRLSDGNRASSNADANAYYERALLFGGVGTANPEQAERMLEQALAIDPAFAAARAESAFFLVARILNGRANDAGLFYQAESKARQALQDDPHCGRAHSVLALVFLLQGRKELAMGELKQALEENPRDPTAHGWLINYHRFNGDYERARQEADSVLRQWPLFWPAHLDLGELKREQGDLQGAIQEQSRVLEQDPQNIDAITALTRAYIDAADLVRARLTIERARADDRSNFGLRQQRAILLALEGHTREAAREMDAEVEIYAGMQIFGPAAAADYYAVVGDQEKALEWLDRGVRMGDDREDYFRRNPMLANLRALSRFQQILDAVAYRRGQREPR